jgi:hypothetical protein
VKVRPEGERLTWLERPVPFRVTDCVLPATLLTLSVTVRDALRLPLAAGVKTTVMVQEALAASVLGDRGQVVVSLKSPAFAPVGCGMLVIVKLALPVLVRVTDCEGLATPTVWLPKVRLVAERPTLGPLPVPVRLTLCVLPATLLLLSVMLNVAVRVPGALGVIVTVMVQLPPAATELPQVLV